MKMFKKDEGFTLIELMVVVLIIGILVAIAIPVFNSARGNAQQRSCGANQRTVEGAAHAYESSAGILPTAANIETELVTEYLAKWPKCPTNGVYTWDPAGNAGGGKFSCGTHAYYGD